MLYYCIVNGNVAIDINKNNMKTFLKVFATVSLTMLVVISFIRLDFNLSEWGESGRGAYLFFSVTFSAIFTAVHESGKSTK